MSNIGKDFERQVSFSIQQCFGWEFAKIPDVVTPKQKASGVYSWQDYTRRPCDFVVPLPTGKTLWLECKATSGTAVPLNKDHFKPHQWEVFDVLIQCHQPAWVLVQFMSNPTIEKPRAVCEVWAVTAAQALHLHRTPSEPQSIGRDWCRKNAKSVVQSPSHKGRVWNLLPLMGGTE